MAEPSTKRILSEEQLAFYHENDFLVIPDVIDAQLLDNLQKPVEAWVESLVQQWHDEGLLVDNYFTDLPFNKRLYAAWDAAGRPTFGPYPDKEIISQELFDLMRNPTSVEVVRELTGDNNLIVHGVFHCRPNLPHQEATDTPWHQDAQCQPVQAGSNIVIMWIPFVDVDETNACLEISPGLRGPLDNKLFKNYKDPHGYYISIHPDEAEDIRGQAQPMRRGSMMVFNEMVPHRALPNLSETIRWSIDIRYEKVGTPESIALAQGFVCSHDDDAQVEASFENWSNSKWR